MQEPTSRLDWRQLSLAAVRGVSVWSIAQRGNPCEPLTAPRRAASRSLD